MTGSGLNIWSMREAACRQATSACSRPCLSNGGHHGFREAQFHKVEWVDKDMGKEPEAG